MFGPRVGGQPNAPYARYVNRVRVHHDVRPNWFGKDVHHVRGLRELSGDASFFQNDSEKEAIGDPLPSVFERNERKS